MLLVRSVLERAGLRSGPVGPRTGSGAVDRRRAREGCPGTARGRAVPGNRTACSAAGGYGMRTRLMTWMTPLDARTSAVTTFERFTNTFWPRTRIFTRLPLSVLIEERLTTRLAASRPEATW